MSGRGVFRLKNRDFKKIQFFQFSQATPGPSASFKHRARHSYVLPIAGQTAIQPTKQLYSRPNSQTDWPAKQLDRLAGQTARPIGRPNSQTDVLPIAGQTARPIGRIFFVDTHRQPRGVIAAKQKRFFKIIFLNIFFLKLFFIIYFFSNYFFPRATLGPSASLKYKPLSKKFRGVLYIYVWLVCPVYVQ